MGTTILILMNYFHQTKKTAYRISDLTSLMIAVRDKSPKVCNILFSQLPLFYFMILSVMSISFSLRLPVFHFKVQLLRAKATLNKTYTTDDDNKSKI